MNLPNNLVNYIWVGSSPIPDKFYSNFEKAQQMNPEFVFKLWRDTDIVQNTEKYREIYNSLSIFHKLQIGKYTIMNSHGGIYSDFDIDWKVPFSIVYDSIEGDPDMVFMYRDSLHFYNMGMKTTLVDDFFSITKPGNTHKYLTYCEQRTERRDNITEPYSVYALTEWLLNVDNVKFLTHKQIDVSAESLFGIHDNKRTWGLDSC